MVIIFTEKKRNKPHWSGWHNGEVDHIDTYFSVDGGEPLFLRGVVEGTKPNSNDQWEIESLKRQLINSNFKYVCFYCHAPIGDGRYAVDFLSCPEDGRGPLKLLEWVREHKLTFEPFSRFNYISSLKVWEFGGNTREYSAAFTFRIWDRALAIKVKKQFNELPIAARP